MNRPTVSVVFPVFNEETVLPLLIQRLDGLVADLEVQRTTVEAVFVNDGSRDRSMDLLREAAQTRRWIRVLAFSRNFGHQSALTAGMKYATGDAVVVMDSDLQDPPELLPRMIAKWREGWDVVYAVRTRREGETVFKRFTAAMFYRLLRRLTPVEIPADTGDCRLMDRKVVDAVNQMGEYHRFLRGLSAWVGYKQIGLPYDREPRAAGETKYPLKRMLNFAIDGITGFSLAPLQLASYMGFVVTGIALLGIVVAIILRLFPGINALEGQTTTLVSVLFLGGIQLISLGIIGEYVGRIYNEVKHRPLYIVAEKIGFEDSTPERNLPEPLDVPRDKVLPHS